VVVAELPLPRQHFFQFCGVVALGFYWVRKRLASFFFDFLNQRLHGPNGSYPVEKGKDLDANGNSAVTILRKLATAIALAFSSADYEDAS
jgi:hypothetical protein